MKNQIQLIELLTEKFVKNVKKYVETDNPSIGYYISNNYMNKNHGKTALKRQIVTLRQELLNLSDMIDKE